MPTALQIVHYHSNAQCTSPHHYSVHYHSITKCTLPQHYTVYTTTAVHTAHHYSVHHHSSTVYITTSLQCTSPQQYTVYITSLQCTLPQHYTAYITTACAYLCVCVRVRLCVRVCVSVCMHTDQCHVCINGLNSLTFWDIIFSNCICRTLLYVCIEYCI